MLTQSYVRVNDIGMLTQSYVRVNNLGILTQSYVRVNSLTMLTHLSRVYTRQTKTKEKHNTIYVGHQYAQTNTNNVNKT